MGLGIEGWIMFSKHEQHLTVHAHAEFSRPVALSFMLNLIHFYYTVDNTDSHDSFSSL